MLRWTTTAAHLLLCRILPDFRCLVLCFPYKPNNQINYSLLNLGLHLFTCVAPLFLRGISLLGPCAVQPTPPSDHPRGEPRGVLPGDVGAAGERRHFQHRAADHRCSPLQQLSVSLVRDLCPVFTCAHNPMQISNH